MKTTLLEPGKYYHVYNRARNGYPLFGEEEDFRFFLKLYQTHVCPIAETYAYCLLSDHLHFLIRIRDEACGSLYKNFALLFNAYAKGYNKHNGKEGKLFRFKMKRKEIRSVNYILELIRYINQNPWRHGVTEHPANYRFSSFRATLTTGQTMVAKELVQSYFGTRENLTANLLTQVDEEVIRPFILEELPSGQATG
ncbi:MAG: transposase [Bacteroidota bacterium]